jgi:hypothetical protein
MSKSKGTPYALGEAGMDRERMQEEAAEHEFGRAVLAEEPAPSVAIAGEYASVREVATRHRLSEKTIRKYIADGRLKAQAVNPNVPPKQRRWRVHRDDELAWIESKNAITRTTAHKQSHSKTGRSFRERVKR